MLPFLKLLLINTPQIHPSDSGVVLDRVITSVAAVGIRRLLVTSAELDETHKNASITKRILN